MAIGTEEWKLNGQTETQSRGQLKIKNIKEKAFISLENKTGKRKWINVKIIEKGWPNLKKKGITSLKKKLHS